MITSQNLRFAYSDQKQFTFPDIHCQDGEALLVLGQSGKGKTTLLHLLALLLTPENGKIILGGKDSSGMSLAEKVRARATDLGIVYQKGHFVGALTVLDNLLLPNYLSNAKQDKSKAIALAAQLGFQEHLHKKTTQLSQGEQQRVSIARALMNNPNVVLADEPTSSLDDENCFKVVELLKNQVSAIGASLIVVTHDQRLKDAFHQKITL